MKIIAPKALLVCLLLLTACGGDGNSRLIGNFGGNGGSGEPEIDDVNRGDDDPWATLRPLIGRVNFRYRFFDSTDAEFSRTVVFSSANLLALESGNFAIAGLNTAGDPTACAYAAVPNHPYACGMQYLDGSFDYFLFSEISGGTAAGNYEFCGSGEADCATYDASGTQLLLDPDGTVDVIVISLMAFAEDEQQQDGEFDSSAALHDLDHKLYYEQFTQMAPQQRASESATNKDIDDAFDTVRTILKELGNR